MKGIAHFSAGIAIASFFPSAIEAAGNGNPFLMLLGGFNGLLADTLDFKVSRYFCRYDIEVAPDPLNPNARQIADAVKSAVAMSALRKQPACINRSSEGGRKNLFTHPG